MNKDFFNTTVGRFVISLCFAVGALVVAEIAEFVSNNQNLFLGTGGAFALLVINALIFAGKNFFNPKVKNI